MLPQYPIIILPKPILTRRRLEETTGTKTKYWLRNTITGREVMVKYGRPNTGEDWSEKLAYELGQKLHVPCPRVDLFEDPKGRGVLCWGFLRRPDPAVSAESVSLIHGNELLFQRDPEYPLGDSYGVVRHTLVAVEGALSSCRPITNHRSQKRASRDGFDTFVGYLMLDALIGNTDRHHENWGVVSERTSEGHSVAIAPSYDHASSLGRELTDAKRLGRLGSGGQGTVADYANKALSAFWSSEGSKLTTLQALKEAASLRPKPSRCGKHSSKTLKLSLYLKKFSVCPKVDLVMLVVVSFG